MSPIIPAVSQLSDGGIPYSAAFDDIYHSQAGGMAQAREVFFAGNDLPERWRGRERFVIAETGFGLGLSFLATWAEWQADPQRCARLHFVSCELHPFNATDLAQLHRREFADEPGLLALSTQMIAQWPMLVPGMHRLEFDGGRVVLTLLLGDAHATLPQLAASVDAFFLDGFSPAKNPALWQDSLFKQFARLAATDATLATYTVAGAVRRGLEAAGFAVKKRIGFGYKRQMLTGQFRGRRTSPALPDDRHAIVVGAGLAGSAIAERLATRGWRITLLERHAGPAQEASGNHAGAYRPVVSADDNLQARLARAAFLHGLRRLDGLPGVRWQRCGALQLARNPSEAERFARIAREQAWPDDYLRYVDRDEAGSLAGVPVAAGGLWFAQGGWINPPSLAAAQLHAAQQALTTRYGADVAELHHADGLWRALDSQGSMLANAPVLILANAADAARFAPELALGRDVRVVSHLPADSMASLKTVVCRGGYLTPAHDGLACLGSSPANEGAPAANLRLLDQMIEGAAAQHDAGGLAGRHCTRPGTPDRLPIVGALADTGRWQPKHAGSLHLAPRRAGLYALTGFGARGLVWHGLMAELLASQICGEPLPIERDLAAAVDPARFLARGRHASPEDESGA